MYDFYSSLPWPAQLAVGVVMLGGFWALLDSGNDVLQRIRRRDPCGRPTRRVMAVEVKPGDRLVAFTYGTHTTRLPSCPVVSTIDYTDQGGPSGRDFLRITATSDDEVEWTTGPAGERLALGAVDVVMLEPYDRVVIS